MGPWNGASVELGIQKLFHYVQRGAENLLKIAKSGLIVTQASMDQRFVNTGEPVWG